MIWKGIEMPMKLHAVLNSKSIHDTFIILIYHWAIKNEV